MEEEKAIAAPPELLVTTFYDPFVFATPDPEFFEHFDAYDRAIDQRFFAEFWGTGAIRSIHFAGETPPNLPPKIATRMRRDQGMARIDCEPSGAEDIDLRQALLSVVRYDYLTIVFTVDLSSAPLLSVLKLWTRSELAPPQSVWAGAYALPYPKLLRDEWVAIQQLVMRLPPSQALAAFGNEGTMVAVISARHAAIVKI